MCKALFLDRDGTLIVAKDYLSDPKGVELLPGICEALDQALKLGYHLFLFTNQSGVGRGFYSMDDVHACTRRMLMLMDLPEPVVKEICNFLAIEFHSKMLDVSVIGSSTEQDNKDSFL